MSALANKLAGLRRQAGAAGAAATIGRPFRDDASADAAAGDRTAGGTPATAMDADEPGTAAARTGLAPFGHVAGANASRPPGPPASTAVRGPRDTAAQLRRLLDLRPQAPLRPSPAADRVLPGEEIAPGLFYSEAWTPWPQRDDLALHGIGQGEVARERVLAFDTETTGLAGGTGTRAFMIGAADWRDGRLRLRQLLIATLAAERAMLETFAGWLDAGTVLLSYNGKSYDRPLLSTRYRLARLSDPLPACGHIDLLHPMRRRYRQVWPNCRLATAERELLGVLREDDLPGAQAPAAWLQYLRGGSAATLRRVGQHNAQDLRSLCGLLERLADGPATAHAT